MYAQRLGSSPAVPPTSSHPPSATLSRSRSFFFFSPSSRVALCSLCLVTFVYFLLPRRTPASEFPPKVLLISLDGFRYDLLNQTMVPNIFKWAEESTWFVNGVIPQHRTYTAPNHLSIVTGLFEENHGVTGNRFVMEDGKTVVDYYGSPEAVKQAKKLLTTGKILQGDPVWLANERISPTRKSTVIKWPFAEALFEKEPHRPHQFEPFTVYGTPKSFEKDVDSAIRAFTEKKPSNFVALYVDQPDAILHHFGFYTGDLKRTMSELDSLFGYLLLRLKETNLLEEVNIVLTADHGHAEVIDYQHVLCIRDYVEGDFRFGDLQIYPENAEHEEEIYRNLTKGISERGLQIEVYRKKDYPDRFHYKNTPRTGGILLEPAVGSTASFKCTSESQEQRFGKGGFHSSVHGQSPDNKEMRALLVMSGPEIKERNMIQDTPQNVDLYPLLCYLLQVEPSPNNGSWTVTEKALKKQILYNMK